MCVGYPTLKVKGGWSEGRNKVSYRRDLEGTGKEEIDKAKERKNQTQSLGSNKTKNFNVTLKKKKKKKMENLHPNLYH